MRWNVREVERKVWGYVRVLIDLRKCKIAIRKGSIYVFVVKQQGIVNSDYTLTLFDIEIFVSVW